MVIKSQIKTFSSLAMCCSLLNDYFITNTCFWKFVYNYQVESPSYKLLSSVSQQPLTTTENLDLN